MAISRVQGASNTSAIATCAVTLSSTAAGNLLALLFTTNGGTATVSSVIDSGANSWTKSWLNNDSTSQQTGLYFFPNNGGGITSVTVTLLTAQDIAAWAWEWSGITSSPVDGTPASAAGDSTAPASGNTTTTNAADLLLGGIAWNANSATLSGATSGFTQETKLNSGGNAILQPCYQIVSATGTYSLSGTLSAAKPWVAGISAFKGTGGVAANGQFLQFM
jgi:hypothetical protein